jgi:peptidoglycan/xylan/chitin deacetylase (PgdA/CDA1 family)
VVTDLAGGSADWQRAPGTRCKLMTKEHILALRREGVHFGSHLASHTAVDCLSSRELAAELARSRATLETWFGHSIQSFAAPFGICDERLSWLARYCGYRIGFTTAHGVATLNEDRYRVPRIEVQGDWSLPRFIEVVESSRQ